VRCHDAKACSFVIKVRGEVFMHFHTVAVKFHSMPNWPASQYKFFVSNSHLCRIKWWACNWLWSSPVASFGLALHLLPLLVLHMAYALFLERLSNHRQGLHRTFSKICTQFDAVPLLDPSLNCMRTDTRLQIEGRNKPARPPSCMKFCIPTPKIS
jgi:hypothetical protein